MESGGGEGEGGSRRKEKGEKRKVSFTLSPYPHPLAVFFFLFILLGPFPTIRTLSVARLSVSAHEQKRRACTEKASERAKKGGKKVVLIQLFSFRSPYYLTAYNRLVHFTPMCK